MEDFALKRGIIQPLETEPQSRILTVAQLISTVKEEVDTLKEEINAKQQLLAERENSCQTFSTQNDANGLTK